MKFKNKYVALGLLLSFISCDLFMNDEMKEKSLDLVDKVTSILDASEKSIGKSTKKRRKVSKKRLSASRVKRSGNNSNLVQNVMSDDMTSDLQNDVHQDNVVKKSTLEDSLEINDGLINEEIPRVKLSSKKSELREKGIQNQQNAENKDLITTGVSTVYGSSYDHAKMVYGSSTFLSSESGELKETIERNEIDFTIDSDLRPEDIAGSNTVSYTDEIEEEDYDQYYLEDDEDKYDEEETRLDNRYKSYLEGVRYNVGSAIGIIDKVYNNYRLFEEQRTRMYSTRLDADTKAQAKKEAEKFTKQKLEKDLNALLNYIQVSAKTATNFVYIMEIHAKSRLDKLATEVKSLISKVQGQSNPYEAYKAIVSPILQMKDSLKVVQGAVDKDGPWY
ncbi:ferrous iron transporter A [Borrelia puertoricensis]|uniref:ferrous iron transporter A n=1 Tax=Borrelia puertoricensis TaxID=2756107 RepID=UPI001FF15752|nr:ferrous iron transporter A [Borrelia puertoricensis]UPA19134.1 ferrous iron transporter A [Borrelia puertoricensis]